MKKLIIFDFFGVIGGELSPIWFSKYYKKEEALILKDKYFIPADNGEYDIKETIEHMASDLGHSYEEIYEDFKKSATINYELLDYILELRKKYNVALLSNAADGIFDMFFPNLDINKYFDKVFISAKFHMQKPNLDFYKLCIDSFDTKFDEIYMIDDNPKNLKEIHKLGIKGILYSSNKDVFIF